MIPVFIQNDALLPDAGEIAGHLEALGTQAARVQTFSELALIQEALQNERRAVVVFSTPPEQIAMTVQKIRLALPSAACLAVVNREETGKLDLSALDCLLLSRPADAFLIRAQVSAAIRQSELLATVTDCAQLDEVTSLFNRRYFIQRLSEEISLSRRHLTPLCCVILSINYYKMFLDSYGYEFINQLLRFLAEKVSSGVRHEDIVARVSDDEIGILLPRSTEKGAKSFTNRLVLELNAATFTYQGYDEEISVCAGVAGYPLPENAPADADTVIRYARHALHQAKCSEDEHIRVQLFSEIEPVL